MQRVCVQPPASAVNTTLLAFAAQRRRTARLHAAWHPQQARRATIDRYLLPAAANPPHAPPLLSIVLSRLDYCNSLLIDLPLTHIQRLQSVQNAACSKAHFQPETL